MANITLGDNKMTTVGNLPEVGTEAPDFSLVSTDLTEKTLADYANKTIILNIFPSIDTGVCAESTRRFNSIMNTLENTVVLCISKDLPFALDRFCGAEGLENVIPLSDFRGGFAKNYAVQINQGVLEGLLSRAITVIKENKIIYTEQVPEIAQEPNYDAAIAAIQ
jgi:thiol peroxidase